MTYLTPSDLVQRVGADRLAAAMGDLKVDGSTLADALAGKLPTNSAEAALAAEAAGRIEAAITDAEAEIDSALSARYALPLPEVPALLVRVAADLALDLLYGDTPPEEHSERKKRALGILKQIRLGERQLSKADGTLLPQRRRTRFSSPPPILTGPQGALRGY